MSMVFFAPVLLKAALRAPFRGRTG